MQVVLIVGIAAVFLSGIIGRLYRTERGEDRRRAVVEILLLAVIFALGLGVLIYFPLESWSEGVATGFFAVVAYDTLKMFLGLVAADEDFKR